MAEDISNPPSYNELDESPYPSTISGHNETDDPPPYSPHRGAPPDYFSIITQIQDLRAENSNHFVFLRKTGLVLLNTVGGLALLFVLMAVPVTMLVIGIVFIDDCPYEPFIPIYLVLAGVLGMIKNISQIGERLLLPVIRRRTDEQRFKSGYCAWKIVNIVYTFVMFAWLVVGSYFIYSNYSKLNNSGNFRTDRCHEGFYKFAFGITTACYILATCLVCCVCCCGLCQVRDNQRGTQRQRLNNEVNHTSADSQITSPELNPISNPIQNGHCPANGEITSPTDSVNSNHIVTNSNRIGNINGNAAVTSPPTSHHTLETLV